MISVFLVILVVFFFLRDVRTTLIPERRRSGLPDRNVRRDVSVRLQPRQSVADGAHHFHGICGGRCDRRDREYHPLSGTGHAAIAGRLKGRAGNRLYRAYHQHFAGGCLHSLLLMGGIVGRLFREFAVTLSVAIVVSMVVSLTTTPMMCALSAEAASEHMAGCTVRASAASTAVVSLYGWTLERGAAPPRITLLLLLGDHRVECLPLVHVPKGFFPQQDNGRMVGSDSGRPGHFVSSHGPMLLQMIEIIEADPAVDSVNGFTGGGGGASIPRACSSR